MFYSATADVLTCRTVADKIPVVNNAVLETSEKPSEATNGMVQKTGLLATVSRVKVFEYQSAFANIMDESDVTSLSPIASGTVFVPPY